MGKNMQIMLAFATANAGWHELNANPEITDKRAQKRAIESLEAAGLVKTRALKSGVVQFSAVKAKRATSSKGPKAPAADKGPTKLDQVVTYARENPEAKRADLMGWMQTNLGMSKQGSSTYVQLARKALRDGPSVKKSPAAKAEKTTSTSATIAASTVASTNSTAATDAIDDGEE